MAIGVVGRAAPGRLQRPDRGVRRNVQDVLHPLCRQTVPEPRGHPERVVPRGPPGAEVPPCPGLPQHLQGQAGLRLIPPLGLWHARRRTAGGIRSPSLRQIQALVHQGPPRGLTWARRRPERSRRSTPAWQLATFPRAPQYCRVTPTDLTPCLGKSLPSNTQTAKGGAPAGDPDTPAGGR